MVSIIIAMKRTAIATTRTKHNQLVCSHNTNHSNPSNLWPLTIAFPPIASLAAQRRIRDLRPQSTKVTDLMAKTTSQPKTYKKKIAAEDGTQLF